MTCPTCGNATTPNLPTAQTSKFQFVYKLRSEPSIKKVEILAANLTEAATLFLESQYSDGESHRTCDEIEQFSVYRL
jgi:hypothetical protein